MLASEKSLSSLALFWSPPVKISLPLACIAPYQWSVIHFWGRSQHPSQHPLSGSFFSELSILQTFRRHFTLKKSFYFLIKRQHTSAHVSSVEVKVFLSGAWEQNSRVTGGKKCHFGSRQILFWKLKK